MTLQAWLLHYPHIALGVMVAGLYLSDCFVLSPARHLLGTAGGDGRIRSLLSPGRVVIVRGKVLYFLPPLIPWRPVYRIALTGGADTPPARVTLAPVLITKIAVGLIVVATLGLIVKGGHPTVALSCLVTYYATGLLGVLLLRTRLPDMGWLRVVQCTLCPPHALNLLRRTTLAQPPIALNQALGPLHSQRELQHMRTRVAPLRDVLEGPFPAPLGGVVNDTQATAHQSRS